MARWLLAIAAVAGCSTPPDLLHAPGDATRAADAIAAKLGRPRDKIGVLKVVVRERELDVYVPDPSDPTSAARYAYFDGNVSAPRPVMVDGDADISTFPLDALRFDMVPGLTARLGFELGAPVTQLRLQFNALDRTIPLLVAASFGDRKGDIELYPDGRVYELNAPR